MNKEESLRSIRYINVPEGMRVESDIFRLDKNIMLPVQLKTGESRLKAEDITLESITAGMLTVIAYDENHKDASYYKDFVLTIDPTFPDKLMKAAIAKEEQKDYEFSEELFLALLDYRNFGLVLGDSQGFETFCDGVFLGLARENVLHFFHTTNQLLIIYLFLTFFSALEGFLKYLSSSLRSSSFLNLTSSALFTMSVVIKLYSVLVIM